MKNFKGNFGVQAKSEILIKAFAQTVIELGWKQKPTTCSKGICLFFGSGKTEGTLSRGEFWQPTTVSSNPKEGIFIYDLPAQWDKAVKAASAEAELEFFKEGDWVVVLPTDEFYSNAEQGTAQLILEVRPHFILPYKLKFGDGSDNSYKEVRKATAKEIAAAKKKLNVVVKIAGGTRGVTITSTGVISSADHKLTIDGVRKLHAIITTIPSEVPGIPWSISVPTVTIGCTSGVTAADLAEVIRAYEKLNG